MRQFAAEEFVIPEGKAAGLRWACHRQPYQGLLFDAIDSGLWTRVAAVGPVQSGKTLCAYVMPHLYHLFEYGESVVSGVPTMDVAGDKWRLEIRRGIEATRFKAQLPSSGHGSRGGSRVESVTFRNGQEVKFMSGAGRDEKRSSYTARVASLTEADKFDVAGEGSRETDPVSQIEARLGSYDVHERMVYMECTASIPTGRIWREYTAGTQSRIACPCPHCGDYVTPERKHLRGWESAENAIAAGLAAYFVCPICEKRIDDKQRRTMNLGGVLAHRGQAIDRAGVVTGDVPQTNTLGFRWNAFGNLFWSIEAIGRMHWQTAHADDEDAAERELSQFYWAQPWTPPDVELTSLTFESAKARMVTFTRGLVPADTVALTAGVDLGKFLGHWVVIAWRSDGRCHVVDFGVFEINTDDLGVLPATAVALKQLRDDFDGGFACERGERRSVDLTWIDSNYADSREAVFAFCRDEASGGQWRYLPTRGYGASERMYRNYRAPKSKTGEVRAIGDGFHITRLRGKRVNLVHVDANQYKSQAHDRLSMPPEHPGAMTVCRVDDPRERTKFAKHITAEKPVEKQQPGKPPVVEWDRIRRANHYLDSTSLGIAAGVCLGAKLAPSAASSKPAATSWFAQQKKGQR